MKTQIKNDKKKKKGTVCIKINHKTSEQAHHQG